MNQIYLFLTLVFIPFFSNAQEAIFNHNEKGKVFIYWGWNRGMYSASDIRFQSANSDFTLSQVQAKDRPTPFALDPYFHPERITIPQTNLRIGYFFKDNWSVSLGDDHMKYVMTNNQMVKINGSINQNSSIYDGTYDNEDFLVTPEFLLFEHTDGLNYVNAEIRNHQTLWQNEQVAINYEYGIGLGILYPKTNATFLGMNRHDAFHVAGFGSAILAGVNVTFWKYFFLQSELKNGYINMPDIIVSTVDDVKASQQFFFTQWNILFGFNYFLPNKTVKKEVN